MQTFIFLFLLLFTGSVQAKVQALFHPQDPTLDSIAGYFSKAQSSIDIAMYNMDTTPNSPIIQKLQSAEMQKRLQSGELKIRLLLELYGTPEENDKKRQAMEDLGVDVRFLGNAVKVHHKFVVIDADGAQDRVITGSANWSLWSANNYNENILFFTHEPEVTARYQQEFNRLWNASTDFGIARGYPEVVGPVFQDQEGVEVYFNSPRTLDPKSTEPSYLTGEIVRLIDGAQTDLQIASTRIRLVPILEALLKAADRGVKIQAVISQDDFKDLKRRSKYLFGNPNIQLRIKFYNLKVDDYISYQMHNKFMIVDHQTLMTGSFNWSESSEKNHIENIVVLSGPVGQQVLASYQAEFSAIWDLGRNQYAPLLQALQSGQHPECVIPQMVLAEAEISQLLGYGQGCK